MTSVLSSTGDQVTVSEVLDAIDVLPAEQQQEVIDRMQADGGITPEFGLRIAALIDAQIGAEGGLDAIDAEQRQLALLQPEISRPIPAESMPPEVHDAIVASELSEQQQTYDQWFQGMQGIERQAARRAEGSRRQEEMAEADQLRQMLQQKPQN